MQEIEYSIASGADEIDIVISRRHVLEGNWKALYKEVKDFREKVWLSPYENYFSDWRAREP